MLNRTWLVRMAVGLSVMVGCGGEPQVSGPNYEWFLVVADGMELTAKKAGANEYQELVGNVASPGDVVHVVAVDATGHRLVSTLTVPAGDARRRFRDPQVLEAMGKARPLMLEESNGGSVQLELPRLGDTVRAFSRSTFPKQLILVGSPIYDRQTHKAWSMTDGWVPQGVALETPGSPFAEAAPLPAETFVRWLEPQEWGIGDYNRKGAREWWALFFSRKGAKLTCMSTSPAIVFDTSVEQNLPLLKPVKGEVALKQWKVDWVRTSKKQTGKPKPPGRRQSASRSSGDENKGAAGQPKEVKASSEWRQLVAGSWTLNSAEGSAGMCVEQNRRGERIPPGNLHLFEDGEFCLGVCLHPAGEDGQVDTWWQFEFWGRWCVDASNKTLRLNTTERDWIGFGGTVYKPDVWAALDSVEDLRTLQIKYVSKSELLLDDGRDYRLRRITTRVVRERQKPCVERG